MESCRDLLLREFRDRKERNVQFSLRAFAKFLDTSPAQLSQIISGKRRLSQKQANKLANRLGLSPHDRMGLLKSMNPALIVSEASEDYQSLREDEFRLISDWRHYAILSLSLVRKSRADPKWIGERLGISELEAQEAFNRLKRLGLVSIRGDKFKQISKPLTTTPDVASAYVRKFHQNLLTLSAEKLEQVPIELRDFSAILFAANTSKLPLAKKMIKDFRRKLCGELERGSMTEVYSLNIQLVPVTSAPRRI